MKLRFTTARDEDVPAILALHAAVAARLTEQFGRGHWSQVGTERGVRHAMRTTRYVVARSGRKIVGSLRLATKKPWAIDVRYFTPVKRPLYPIGMAVSPTIQRGGVGRELLEEAKRVAIAWPADAIRLDAYDSRAGAGPFYEKCGYEERGRKTYRRVPLVYYELVL